MALHTQNHTFHAGFEIITDNGDSACFVVHNDLADFEQSTGVSEGTLFWAAARGEMVRFDARDWTVGFLLPYDPNTDTAECECWEEDMAGDLMVAC